MSNYEMDEDSRKTAIENLSDWDFENEIDEITRLSKLIGLTVTKINS
jgi:tRNA A58 N-methylase Trm61